MKALFLFPYTLIVWLYTAFSFCFQMITSYLLLWIVPKQKRSQVITRYAASFGAFGVKVLGMNITTYGLENVKACNHFILAPNHQSILDIPVLMIKVPQHFVFFAKKELLKIPMLGWNLKQQGHFMVTRDNPRQAKKEMAGVEAEIEREKRNLLIFPEGTRSITGELGRFKRGAFMAAVRTGTPMIPVYIDGTGYIINKKRFLMQPGKINIAFGEPVQVEKATPETEREAALKLMGIVEERINEMKAKYQIYDVL